MFKKIQQVLAYIKINAYLCIKEKYTTMNAGLTDLKLGVRVKLQNIKGEDEDLNSCVGTVTHPFAFGETGSGWVGVYLDSNVNMPYGGKCNVRVSECLILE